jgi:hypothetical protein
MGGDAMLAVRGSSGDVISSMRRIEIWHCDLGGCFMWLSRRENR